MAAVCLFCTVAAVTSKMVTNAQNGKIAFRQTRHNFYQSVTCNARESLIYIYYLGWINFDTTEVSSFDTNLKGM